MEEQRISERNGTCLRKSDDGLTLTEGTLEITGDFTRLLPRLKPNNLNGELLVRAARIRGKTNPVAVDATAGMGEDSFLLAAAGFEVTLFEYDPVIASLLEDALERAGKHPELAAAARRMKLFREDSINALPRLGFIPDVVVLDPMFPERSKNAAVKKKFQLIHLLEQPCEREEELLAAALSTGAHKIVIKRPLKGPCLGGKKPSYSLNGKAIRYDVILQV